MESGVSLTVQWAALITWRLDTRVPPHLQTGDSECWYGILPCLSLPGPAAPFVHQCHLPGKLIDLGLLSSNNLIGSRDATNTGGVPHQWTRGRWRSGCRRGCGGVGGVASRGTDDPCPLIAATIMDSVVGTLLQAALLSCAVDLIHDEGGLHLSKGRVQCGPGPPGTEAQHGAHHLGISPVPAVITANTRTGHSQV